MTVFGLAWIPLGIGTVYGHWAPYSNLVSKHTCKLGRNHKGLVSKTVQQSLKITAGS